MSGECLSEQDRYDICNNISSNDWNDWIPVVGPSLKGYKKKSTDAETRIKKKFDDTTSELDIYVDQWRTTISNSVYRNSQIAYQMLNVFAGKRGTNILNNDGYVGLVASLTVEPIAERQGYIIVTVVSIIIVIFLMFPKIIEK